MLICLNRLNLFTFENPQSISKNNFTLEAEETYDVAQKRITAISENLDMTPDFTDDNDSNNTFPRIPY